MRMSPGMRGTNTSTTPSRTAATPTRIRTRPRSCIMRSMPDDRDGEKHRETVRASFDKQAVEFSESPVMTDRAALERLVGWAAVSGGERVLDVACGPGLVAAAFAPHVAQVVGVDLTPAMLARATAVVRERVWLSALELEVEEWITRAHPAPADGARAREMLEAAARGEFPGLHAWHADGALRFTVGLQLVRAVKGAWRPTA